MSRAATTRSARTDPPRTKPSAQRRRELLDAGLAVFTERGVGAATVEEIARQAGVAKGTFYLHFPSKEHLLLALQRQFEQRLVGQLDAAICRPALRRDWAGRADAWVQAVFDDFPASRELHDLLFHHSVEVRPVAPAGPDSPTDRADGPQPTDGIEPTDPPHDLVASLTQLITAGRAAGAYQVAEPELTAVLLCGAVHRAFDRIWHRADMDDTPRLVAAAKVLFHRALGLPD